MSRIFKNKNAISAIKMLKDSNGRTMMEKVTHPTRDDKVTMKNREWIRQRQRRLGINTYKN